MENTGHESASLGATQNGLPDTNGSVDPAPACISCRRRKLKCSREVPKCQQCRKTGSSCVYDSKRNKTGMKAGAIETLHRRLDSLEKKVEESQVRIDPPQISQNRSAAHEAQNGPPDVYGILSSLASELRRFNDKPQQYEAEHAHVRNHSGSSDVPPSEEYPPPRKRQRMGAVDENRSCSFRPQTPETPSGEALDALLKAYFSHIHPWIPMIHEGRLRSRISGNFATTPTEQQKLRVLLAAISVVGSRFIKGHELATSCVDTTEEGRSQMRDWVILQGMKRPSVESLQALILLAFHDIGNGEASLAWPIIGSLTRTAEYLQLTVEHDTPDRQAQALVQPYVLLSPAQDWTQEEERRRVFWTIFGLDRYCSVTMGWNTSLTSHDVSRRLPCDGIAWRKEDAVETPFLGIWDKEAGRIGNPIAFLTPHAAVSSPQHHHRHDDHARAATAPTPSASGSTPGGSSFPSPAADAADMSTVGAFAYCIEATESLSRVNTYFLQQRGVRGGHEPLSWLVRFKELDLRLVHWKMFLPRKWKADHVTARPGARMDPNLTLAHLTHNTSMILLHQVVAFPLPEWEAFRHRLPSSLSIDTCHAAAVEIEVIARNFLKCTGREGGVAMPLSSQFAFCVYIAARFLLVFWREGEGGVLAPEFPTLLDILRDMAWRWSGPHELGSGAEANLAARYAQKLDSLHARCVADELYRIDPLGYTTDMDHVGPESVSSSGDAKSYQSTREAVLGVAPDHVEAPVQMQHQDYPANRQPFQEPEGELTQTRRLSSGGTKVFSQMYQHRDGVGTTSEAGSISQMLMDQQFLDLDRVISFDEGMFGSEFDGDPW